MTNSLSEKSGERRVGLRKRLNWLLKRLRKF